MGLIWRWKSIAAPAGDGVCAANDSAKPALTVRSFLMTAGFDYVSNLTRFAMGASRARNTVLLASAFMRFTIGLLLACVAMGQQAPVCPRPGPGALVTPPPELRSSNGMLRVDFSLRTGVDVYGLTLYCYVYGDGVQSPTLRVHPGDEVCCI